MSEESKELATVDKDVLAKLREGSGENTPQRPFIPIIQVDNRKVAEKLSSGRETEVLCEPRWKRLDKDENGEYVTTELKPFGGVVLKIMWQVNNQGKWDAASGRMVPNGAPYFTSQLFNPSVFFGNGLVNIRYTEDGRTESMTYKELKGMYPEMFKLTGWMFVLYNNEVVRVKVTGASRSSLFDYLKVFKANDSISAHPTVFGVEFVEKPQPHNRAKFEVATDPDVPFDINKVLEAQTQINEMFNSSTHKVMEAMGGEVVEEGVVEEEIKVDAIPFK